MKKYKLGLYEKAMPNSLSLFEKLFLAKQSGFDYVELSIDETEEKISRLDMSMDKQIELRSSATKLGISFESMCLSAHRKYSLGSIDSITRHRGMEIMEKAILFAANMGLRTIQIAGYDVYYENSTAVTKKNFEENLRRSVQLAANYGITLSFETMETPFINTVEKAMYWVNTIGSPYLCVYPDTGNITNAAKLYGTSAISDLHMGAGHISALHLKESLPGLYREIPYGSGHVDFKDMIQTAYAMGVRRFLAEFWDNGKENYEEELQNANSFLRSFLAE
ncbi:MAG: L-ribulose-5-phosphate 3-epimerase [Oscillospiraceae bacterium]